MTPRSASLPSPAADIRENPVYETAPLLPPHPSALGGNPPRPLSATPRFAFRELRGADDALDRELIAEIVDQNPMTDLFLLVVDRDCNRERNVERAADREREHPTKLITCVAIQEIEVWLLALHRDRIGDGWTDVRNECDPKERWAEPLLEELGTGRPGRGRKKAMEALGGQIRSLLGVCDELSVLRDRLDEWRNRIE